MADPVLRVGRSDVAPDAQFGDDVVIEADELVIGPGARIGFSDADDFRTPPGVRVRCRRLILGAGAQVGRSVRIEGGEITLGAGVRVLRHASVRVVDELSIGDSGTVGEHCEISGRNVRIGQELWMLPGAKIGGGSAFENASRLEAGHYLHLGVDTLINTARPVVIGHEVGLGTRTSIYTHGAYPSALEGFPVSFEGVEIGDFTWIPGAVVNPGVRIGRNCVIGVNSLVTSDVPDGSLAAGSPARVIRENAYPRPMSHGERLEFFERFLVAYAEVLGTDARPARRDGAVMLRTPEAAYVAGEPVDDGSGRMLVVTDGGGQPREATTIFDTDARRVRGVADTLSDRFANELRRHGIRFYSRPGDDGRYVDWEAAVPRFGPPSS